MLAGAEAVGLRAHLDWIDPVRGRVGGAEYGYGKGDMSRLDGSLGWAGRGELGKAPRR